MKGQQMEQLIESVNLNPLSIMSTRGSIRFHEFRSVGPHFRSQEMKLPSNFAVKKSAVIRNVVLEVLKLDADIGPDAFEDLVEPYNTFRSNVVLLQDLKTALHSAESELEAMNIKIRAEEGEPIVILPRMRVDEPGPSGRSSPSKGKGGKAAAGDAHTSRRITGLIDINPGVVSTNRKRKARQMSPAS